MTRYQLTPQQEHLLSTLVQLTNEGKLKDPIVPIPIRNGKNGSLEYVLHLRGADSYHFKNIGDMDIFCDLGLMAFRWNRQGIGKLYSLTKAATAAVENQFERPYSPPGPKYRPDLIIQAMTGYLDPEEPGHVTPDVNQITADPILLHTTVEALIYSLLEVIYEELKGPPLIAYTNTLNSFKDAVYNGRLSPKERQTYARQLAGLNEDKDTPLTLRVWPYLYPLLLIAEKR
jgi:hypothetical protein